jgi:hypothetical protein
MKAHEALIAWTPNTSGWRERATAGQVKVGPLIDADNVDWTNPFSHTGGAAYIQRRKLRGAESVAKLFIDFHTLVVRDGIESQVAHEAFLMIDEYAESISPDIAGARECKRNIR